MKTPALTFFFAFVVSCLLAEEPRRSIPAPVFPKDTQEAEVLAVFSTEEDGATFRAYQVQWKGRDVIVADSIGGTEHKKGDTIKFLSKVFEVPSEGGRTKKLLVFFLSED